MSSITKQRLNSNYETLWEIVKQFGKVLESDSNAINLLGVRSESELGASKRLLKDRLPH